MGILYVIKTKIKAYKSLLLSIQTGELHDETRQNGNMTRCVYLFFRSGKKLLEFGIKYRKR